MQVNPHLRVSYTGEPFLGWHWSIWIVILTDQNLSPVWDTSGSTNFDSVRPLSYSEVARKKDSSQLSLKKTKNYQIAGWHLPHMLQHCRAHLSLQCPKSLGCWGEQKCEIWDDIRLLKSVISVRWWTLLYKHNLTYIGFCQQVGKHSAAPLLLCGCQSDLRWESLPELNNWIFF